jgi:hypothetical protein
MKLSRRANLGKIARAVLAFALVAVFMPGASSFAQEKTKPVQGDKQDYRSNLQPGDKGYKDPVKETEQGVKVDGIIAGTLLLGGKVYQIARWSRCYRSNGTALPWLHLKKNQIVNVEYYTGGTFNEGYPFRPGQRVVVAVRVVTGK